MNRIKWTKGEYKPIAINLVDHEGNAVSLVDYESLTFTVAESGDDTETDKLVIVDADADSTLVVDETGGKVTVISERFSQMGAGVWYGCLTVDTGQGSVVKSERFAILVEEDL